VLWFAVQYVLVCSKSFSCHFYKFFTKVPNFKGVIQNFLHFFQHNPLIFNIKLKKQ
jgi:hypothetical protein